MTLFILGISVLSIWTISLFASRLLREDMERLLGEQKFATVSVVAAQVGEEMGQRFVDLELVARQIGVDEMGSPSVLQAYLENSLLIQNLFNAGILVIGLDGNALATVPISSGRVGVNYLDRDYIATVLKEGKPAIGTPVIGKRVQTPIFGMAVPIRNAQGQVIGALAGVIDLGRPNFLDKITKQNYGKTGGFLVIEPKHRLVVTATDKKRIMEVLPPAGVNRYVDRNIAGWEGYSVLINALGEEQLASVKHIPEVGWYVLLGTPTAEAFAPIQNMQQRIFWVTLLLTLLAGGLTWWVLKRGLSPLIATAGAMVALSNADRIPTPLPVNSGDEIGELTAGFNRLIETWTQREDALQQEKALLRSLIDAIPDLIFIKDENGVYLECNKATEQLIGFSRSEQIGKTDFDFFDRETADKIRGHDSKVINGGVAVLVEEWVTYPDGRRVLLEANKTPLFGSGGQVKGLVGISRDITARKQAESQIQALAFSDPLTGLPNRRLLMDRLDQALTATYRHDHQVALLFLDLDNFKTLNDTLGHQNGDSLLKQVAQRLTASVREGDTVARLGGDEFVVILENLSNDAQDAATQAQGVTAKILGALGQSYEIEGHAHHSTVSIGVTLFGGSERESIEEPLKRAELAMYQAKSAGRNSLCFFTPELRTAVTTRATLEAELREAIKEGQLILYYQPQVGNDARMIGVEALVRWRHPQRGLVSPAEFIPIAEASGLILPLGRWVLETACKQLAAWSGQPEMSHLTMAVNVSARQFRLDEFVREVLDICNANGANPQRLKLELTESVLVDNVEDIVFKMNALRTNGVGFSIDDFGTGYSSLSYLKRLPLDQLKIDKSFIRDILSDLDDAAIARMVVALAASLGLSVIAEGVETEAQREFLAKLGCDNYQGYLFSRPLPIEELEVFVRRT
ncbi:MAG: EAL domain-containing protein [Rhodoferax sp.]|nr:EAL domain-containing protein [Rhodoferax sp.]